MTKAIGGICMFTTKKVSLSKSKSNTNVEPKKGKGKAYSETTVSVSVGRFTLLNFRVRVSGQ